MLKKLKIYFHGTANALLNNFVADQGLIEVKDIEQANLVVNLKENFLEDTQFLRSLAGKVLVSNLSFEFLGAKPFDIVSENGEYIAYDNTEFGLMVAIVKACDFYEFNHDWRTLVNNLLSFMSEQKLV